MNRRKFVGNSLLSGVALATVSSRANSDTKAPTQIPAAFELDEVTIDDPKTYASPWKVAFPMTLEAGYQNFEYACHEGNYAMFDSLSGARAVEKAAEETKK